ncbi:MAG: DUF2017 domain-containing protein [Actinomycetota bacterium]|nr:DUF2017 domain-containing protein [Actinomycetota bacterium]
MGRFRATGGGVRAAFDEAEVLLLRQLLHELLELLDDGDEPADDPLADALGIGTSTSAPDDPVLARLFPDAYRDDPEAAADFRRYTERGLRQTKRANAARALASLAGPRDLDGDDARAWLAALNDMRLALGTGLGVTEDMDPPLDDPRFAVYDYLTWLQETLVQALTARS